MLPSNSHRVAAHTAEHVNERIARETEARVAACAAAGAPAIERRIAELDREWDIERAIEANASSIALTGVLLGAFVDRRILVLPALVAGFLLQHALQGWCPPVPVLRRFGFRTQTEIDQERYALKALRGDFRELGDQQAGRATETALRALQAARA